MSKWYSYILKQNIVEVKSIKKLTSKEGWSHDSWQKSAVLSWSDWRLENLRWLCYNCSFLFAVDPFSDRITRNIESKYIHDEEVLDENNTKFYDLDPFYLEHLERIGYEDKCNLNVDDIIDYK